MVRLVNLCSRSAVPILDQPQLIYLLTEIIPEPTTTTERLPINFALVLDRSGSMAGEKLTTMQEAVKRIIEQLDDQDIISIVTFESRIDILASAASAKDKTGLKRLVERIRDGGGTNMGPAITAALRLVNQNANEARINRIVLLTDGVATDRQDDSFEAAAEAGAKGIPISGLGFGNDWNEEFLFELADRSILAHPGSRIGMVDYIPSSEKAAKIFQDVFQSMHVVAWDVLATIRMVQGLEARRVWQVAPLIREVGGSSIQGRSIRFPIGNLEKSGAAYLSEIMLPPRPEGQVRIAQADVAFTTSESGNQRKAEDIILRFSADADTMDIPDKRVMDVLEKVQAFRLQTQALEDAQLGDVGSATRKLRQAVTILLSQGEEELASQMEREANRLEKTGDVSNEGRKTILLTSRKTVRLSE